ncbi:hypothetical protein BH10BAC4_BH10BAC4_20280 [soil metagenome]
MELEEMKAAWTEMSGEIVKQKKLTDKLIIDMTQDKYQNTLSKIKTPELIGSALGMAIVILILINFNRYDTGYLVACAIISIAYLLIMPVLSIRAIYKISNLNIRDNSYKHILADYAKYRLGFLTVQKLSLFLGFILMITSLPVMVKIMGGKNSSVDSAVWLWFLPVGFLFYIVVARWVYRYYHRTTIRAEKILKELEE